MTIDKLLVIIFSTFGIGLTYWFFLMKKQTEMSVLDSVDIIVEGGYNPEVITIPFGKTTRLNFLRKDSISCLEEIVLADFKVRKYLPLNQKVSFEITPNKKGEFGYSCGMNMYHGKIIVR